MKKIIGRGLEIFVIILVLVVWLYSGFKILNYLELNKILGRFVPLAGAFVEPPKPPLPPEPPCPPPLPPCCPTPTLIEPTPTSPPSELTATPIPTSIPTPTPTPTSQPVEQKGQEESGVGGQAAAGQEVVKEVEGKILGVTTLGVTGSAVDQLSQVLSIIGCVCLSCGLKLFYLAKKPV